MNGKCDLCDSDNAELEWFGRVTPNESVGYRICGACRSCAQTGPCDGCGLTAEVIYTYIGYLCRPCAASEVASLPRCVDCGILSDNPQPLVKSSHDLMMRCQPCHDERLDAIDGHSCSVCRGPFTPTEEFAIICPDCVDTASKEN